MSDKSVLYFGRSKDNGLSYGLLIDCVKSWSCAKNLLTGCGGNLIDLLA